MRAAAWLLFPALLLTGGDIGEDAKRWWSHVEFLASDKLAGRQPGSDGHRAAARYVAQRFEELGLKPAGDKGYFQTVPFVRRVLDEQASSLEVLGQGQLVLGRDAILSARGTSGKIVEADAVFVGHGLQVPEANMDDLRGFNLRGKIAVVLRGAPKSLAGPLAAHAQSTAEQWRQLRAAGAIGVLSVTNPKRAEMPWSRVVATRLRPSLAVNEPALVDTTGQQVSASINPEALDRLLAGTGHNAAEIFAAMDEGREIPRFALQNRIRARVVFTSSHIDAENVVAVLPGADAALRSESIVFTAHLDHLGATESGAGDRIYNGAMDNASGVATLIETARALTARKLKRTVIFAAVTAEESGLYGSKYLAAHPVARSGRVVANLNTDMFLPIIPLRGITVLGVDESELGDDLRAAAGQFDIRVYADPEPERNGFIRSDQYSFIRRGVPAVALRFYAAPGTPEAETMRKWRAERYHGASDDLAQPVNKQAAAEFNRIVGAFLERVANRPNVPRWKSESFFVRYAN